MEHHPEAIVESVLIIIICVLAAFGNGSLFIIVFNNKKLQTISNYYVLNLAFADLMVAIVSGPVTAVSMLNQKWQLGSSACIIFGFVTLLTFVASVVNLAMIAVNRYFFIVKWKEYKTVFNNRRALLFGLITWAVSIVLTIPPLLGWSRFSYIPEKSYCFVHWPSNVYYMYFMVIICFGGPLTIMTACYYKILTFTKALKKKLFGQKIKLTHTKKRFFKSEARMVSPEETKLTNTLLIVVACFIICWSPFAITMFFDVYHPYPIPRIVQVGSLILGYLNSMCNPILYGIRSTGFRRGFINLYAKCIPCLRRTEPTVSYFNSSIDSDRENSKHKMTNSNQASEEPTRENRPAVLFNVKVSPISSLTIEKEIDSQDFISEVMLSSTKL